MSARKLPPVWTVVLGSVCLAVAHARDLSFEERVKAQAAIERVHYSHQIGATTPFERAMPREVLDREVRAYLAQTVALDELWHTPITAEMLDREVGRMAAASRMPERLGELFRALGDDPFVIRECLARQTLADRLTRGFFAYDARLHGAARGAAERLRRDLLEGSIDPRTVHAARHVVDLVRREPSAPASEERMRPASERIELDAARFDAWRSQAPNEVGAIGPVVEEPGAFVVRVVLEEKEGHARIASFTVAKPTWDDWWNEAASTFDGRRVVAVASDAPLPALGVRVDSASSDPAPCSDAWNNGNLTGSPVARTGHVVVWTGSEMIVWGGHFTSFDPTDSGGRYDPATDSWRPTSQIGAPAARDGAKAVWAGSEMIVFGGQSGSMHLDTGGRYDPATDSWTPTSLTGAPVGRVGHTAVWTGSRMIVWGGYDGLIARNDGGNYDPASDTWAPVSATGAPGARWNHTAVWTGSRMIVWGGWSGVDHRDGSRYDPISDTWSPTNMTGAPPPRSTHTAVWSGSQMIVWGGRTGSGTQMNTGGRYDAATDTWKNTSLVNAPTAREFFSAVWTGSAMIIWGGGPIATATGGKYDPVANTWSPTPTTGAPAARSQHTAVWTGDRMIVWGGYMPAETDTGGRYDPVNELWTPTNVNNGAPVARERHTAVWTGDRMVVWGGHSLGGDANTGGRYDPATDTWTATTTSGAPAGRSRHTAVWTGDRMIVWGGWNGTYLDTGGRYDPTADAWLATSTSGLAGRYDHTAVWTGDRMIVWGGDHDVQLATGSRYDPSTDLWSATSVAGAPTARAGHTAVWTGGRMIVWGGNGAGVYLASGGRYDPATDTWLATASTGAPAGRELPTATWTGSTMVVWGGRYFQTVFPPGSYVYLDSGGRYDPSADTWLPVSTVGAPAARYRHTALWTGDRMLVWGGVSDGESYATGGKYDPTANAWTATSTSGAPQRRDAHTAVWTGSQMIVWGGGQHGSSLYGNGGRFVVAPDLDGDGVADACDVCPADALDDVDGDGACADADCAPEFGDAFAVPGEITGDHFTDATTLSWVSAQPSSGSGTRHQVLRGAVRELPVGAGPAETCLTPAEGIVGTSIGDPTLPPAGTGFYYLVRGINRCSAGTYGEATGGTERTTVACP